MGTNTGIGIGIGIPFKNNVLGEGKPYLPPEIKDSLKAVVIAYGKTNNDSDRAIVKNLVDPDNPFVISNAAFKLNSGFGKYAADFLDWTSSKDAQKTSFEVKITSSNYKENWVAYKAPNTTFKAMKVRISGIPDGGYLQFFRTTADGGGIKMVNGINEIPAFTNTVEAGFYIDIPLGFDWSNLVIEQIPSFEGAFVTDGIDDLITSTKTVQEMLGGSNEITVVSMIGQLSTPNVNNYTNTIRNQPSTTGSYNKVEVSAIDKTGIYGYSFNSSLKCSIINDILGDKQDYSVPLTTQVENISAKYLVQGWIDINGLAVELSSVAWYWTIIANKVLTTDEINQVIAYYNLDRTLKPDILCNTIKQGITNENHAEFGDKLIDFSGNGRDIQLNNIAWKGNSGIGKYETDFLDSSIWKYKTNSSVTSDKIVCNKAATHIMLLYYSITDENKYDVPSFNVLKQGDASEYYYIDEQGIRRTFKLLDGINTLPASHGTLFTGTEATCGFGNSGIGNSVTITQIPSHAGALCLDGVNDFGKVTGMPIYKDYTVVADRELFNAIGCVLSNDNPGAFIFETSSASAYSFGEAATSLTIPTDKQIRYQTKYSYNGQNISIGAVKEGTSNMWLGTIRDNDARFRSAAIYSLMSFPYSMSEFLIERQLKKHKLGTLYPDMVEFRPIIKANANYNIFYTALLPLTGNIWERINIGDYVPVGRRVAIQLSFDNEASELVSAISSQLGNISITKNSNNKGYTIFGDILKNKSPQKINITIDEYIRFEDIVQPYPVLLRFKDENGNEVSWGGKFRVGSTITRIGSATDSNLLPNIYNIFGLLLNGNQVTSSKVIVEKTMVFKAKSAYIFDNNEPKVILSPRLLRIPNSSYKILGYIPDISGHGNHGKINNSAYAGISGANGYKQDFTSWKTSGSSYSIITDSKYVLTDEKAITNGGYFLWNRLAKDSFKVKISNIPNGGWMSYRYRITEEDTQLSSLFIREDGIYTLPATVAGGDVDFFISTASAPAKDWIGLTIEQIGEYEGAYCLDGVDDFVTIPTTVGGKQVLMKVNSRKSDCYLYDQRNNWTQYLGIVSTKDFIAYNYSNQRGKTYIDGILNENITANDLIGITHNITVTNNRDDVKQYSPCIGTSFARNSYAQMALYDFMLFDNISIDDKIKELNEYVGIEAKVELPPYYWDAYGKTNLDADKATIQQRGVAVGDYDLTNTNFAYDKMSGYGGYSFKSFNDSQNWNIQGGGIGVEIVSRDGYSITIKKLIQNLDWHISNNEYRYPTILDKELPFKCISNKKVGLIWQLKYKTEGATSDTNVTLINQQLTPNVPLEINLPYKTQDELTELGAVSTSVYYFLYFSNTTLEIGEEYTIEMLPLYPNGLLYDAVTDYSENVNIPVFTDFTAIMKRKWLKNQGCPLIKGSKVYEGGNGNALLFEWDKAYNFVFYKRTDIMEGEVPENISFITPTNYNGNVITRGSGQDTNGICIAGDGNAGFANMVFYKLILYPKTIPLLQINFLKNLMERDEIIDLNNPIFIKDE
jgi:hypothetical protein